MDHDFTFEALLKTKRFLVSTEQQELLAWAFSQILDHLETPAFKSIVLIDRFPRTTVLLVPFIAKSVAEKRIFPLGLSPAEMAKQLQEKAESLLGGPCKYLYEGIGMHARGWEVHKVILRGGNPAALIFTAVPGMGHVLHVAHT